MFHKKGVFFSVCVCEGLLVFLFLCWFCLLGLWLFCCFLVGFFFVCVCGGGFVVVVWCFVLFCFWFVLVLALVKEDIHNHNGFVTGHIPNSSL